MVEPLQGSQRGSASGDCIFLPQAGEALNFPLYCGARSGKFQIGLYSCVTATGIDYAVSAYAGRASFPTQVSMRRFL